MLLFSNQRLHSFSWHHLSVKINKFRLCEWTMKEVSHVIILLHRLRLSSKCVSTGTEDMPSLLLNATKQGSHCCIPPKMVATDPGVYSKELVIALFLKEGPGEANISCN